MFLISRNLKIFCGSASNYCKNTMNSMNDSDELIRNIIFCTNFAALKHIRQRRLDPDQTPYINHPIGVAYILTEEAKICDPVVIQAAILHDTVEDTDTTFKELDMLFGKDVCDIVREVTDDKSLPKLERKRLQIVNAKDSSYKAKLVKLADKLHNLRDLQKSTPIGWTEERVGEYFSWSKKVIEGLRGTNEIMEKALDELLK